MKKILVVMNHSLTGDQLKDLEKLNIEPIYLNEDDKKVWGDMYPERIDEFLDRVRSYGPVDYYIVQGQMGATWKLVTGLGARHCWYSQTNRETVEEIGPDNTVIKKAVFKHKGFYSYL